VGRERRGKRPKEKTLILCKLLKSTGDPVARTIRKRGPGAPFTKRFIAAKKRSKHRPVKQEGKEVKRRGCS